MQSVTAMDILTRCFPGEEHVLVFDNANTHLKCDVSHKNAKGTSKVDKNWGVLTTLMGAKGLLVHGPDGKVIKVKVNMCDGEFADGTAQPSYYPARHENAGLFKGMAVILAE